MKDYSTYDDKQLIGFITLEGKEKEFAFKEIYFRYSKRLFIYCKLKCANEYDAEDMLQEVWLIFYRAVIGGKTDIEFPHYLYGIARNLFLQNCKKQNKSFIIHEDALDMDSIISPYISLEASIEKKNLIAIVKLASNYLSDALKETFYLKWFSGLTNNEIANIFGESIESINQRNNRSMGKILKILSPIIKDIEN